MVMPNREFSPQSGYRYGFNGKENDNEVKGGGNQQDYGFRIYDPILGKFLSVDPLTQQYPELTPYQFASNRPLDGVDLDGKEWTRNVTIDNKNKIITTEYTVQVKVINQTTNHNNPQYTDRIMQNVKKQVESSFSRTFKEGDYTYVYKTTMEYKPVSNVSQINDNTDFYVSLNDRKNGAPYGNLEKGRVREIGNTNRNILSASIIRHEWKELAPQIMEIQERKTSWSFTPIPRIQKQPYIKCTASFIC
jgi:RHS repeat-associated protein